MVKPNPAVVDRNKVHRISYRDLGVDKLEVKEVLDVEMECLDDFDGSQMQLFPCLYTIGSCEPIKTLVKKGSYGKKLTSTTFDSLIGLKHIMLVPVLHYYHRGSAFQGWYVVAPVQGSLRGWLKSTGGSLMFKGSGSRRDMSSTFRTMVINLWDLLSMMKARGTLPIEIKLEDFFVTMMADDLPRIQVLITDVRKLIHNVTEDCESIIWLNIDAMIRTCCELSGCQLSEMSIKFCKYVSSHKCDNINNAKNYPDTWSIDDKACYLYHIISGKAPFKRYIMRSKVNGDSKVKWPKDVYVIEAICDLDFNNSIVDTPHGRQRVCKYKSTGYDYLKLCRDSHKHFDDLPNFIKYLLGGTPEEIIKMVEDIDPDIWTKLYEAIGPLGRQLAS